MRTTARFLFSRLFIPLAALLLVTAGCGEEFEDVGTVEQCLEADGSLCESEVFLDVEEFEYVRVNSDPVILDARPDEQDFLTGHVPGANFAAWGEHRDEGGILHGDDDELQDAIQSMGVEADRAVIVYGEGDGSGGDSVAGNLFWTLEYLGHDDVYIVNGGLRAWRDANYDAVATGEDDAEATDFQIERRDEVHADFDDLKDAIDEDDVDIIDTRRYSEWVGDEDRDNPQAGHVPEAVHYHWEDVFQERDDEETEPGLLKSPDQLVEEFKEAGIAPANDPLPYCQSGVRSGYFYAVLKSLDEYDNAVNYDGSWWEWSREADDEYVIVPDDDAESE